MVTPVNELLRLKDPTVVEISSPDIDGTKHSILDIVISLLYIKDKLTQKKSECYCILTIKSNVTNNLKKRKQRSSYHLEFTFKIRCEYTLPDGSIYVCQFPPTSLIHLVQIRMKFE